VGILAQQPAQPRPAIRAIRDALERPVAPVALTLGIERRQKVSLADGVIQKFLPDGTVRTQSADAIPQLMRFVPTAKFVRAHEGDTVEKLAVMNGIEPEAARITAGTLPGHVFSESEIVCLRRRYRRATNETWESIAAACGLTVDMLKELNSVDPDDDRQVPHELLVPGACRYQFRGQGQFNIVTIQYSQSDRLGRAAPREARVKFTVGRGDLETHRVRKEDTLETIARQHNVTPEFLRMLNGLAEDEPPRVGRIFYVRYAVRPHEGVTLDEIAAMRRVSPGTIRKLNKMDRQDGIVAGQPLLIPARPGPGRGK
jgi:LysM repeat protein